MKKFKTMHNIKRGFWFGFIALWFAAATNAFAAPQVRPINFWDDATPTSKLVPDHSAWQAILDKYLIDEHPSGIHRFDYNNVSAEDERKLLEYLRYLQQLDPRQLRRDRQKAYWLNLYNATLVLYIVVREPVDSIRNLNRGKFWDAKRFNIALQELSFNDIEHGILRPFFQDERIHFALCRASLGSANLSAQAYTAENLEAQLDEAARSFVNHSRAVRVQDDEVVLSRMFKWNQEDFGANNQEVKSYLKQYLPPDTAEKIDQTTRVRYQFNWSLNGPE